MLEPSRIRAITLDLDDTLWPVWPTIRRAEEAMRDWLAGPAPQTVAQIRADPQNSLQARRAVLQTQPDIAHNLGQVRLETLRHMLRQAGEDPALADPAYEIFYEQRQQVTLYEDSLPALEFLAARYRLVAVSNGNADVQRVGLGRFFAVHLAAGEVGVAKPDPRMFELAAQACEVPADQVLHVGDDVQLDALAALQAGMQSAWVNRKGEDWPEEHARQRPHAAVRDMAELVGLLG